MLVNPIVIINVIILLKRLRTEEPTRLFNLFFFNIERPSIIFYMDKVIVMSQRPLVPMLYHCFLARCLLWFQCLSNNRSVSTSDVEP